MFILYILCKTQETLGIIWSILQENPYTTQMPSTSPGMRSDIAVRIHVDAYAAAYMSQQGIKKGALYLNNIPCSLIYGCAAQLPYMLPENAKLHEYVKEGNS
jgi:hypothetical protein